MTTTDSRKVAFGLLLLAVSTVIIFGPGALDVTVPIFGIAAGTLGLAAGALLVGTSDPGRPV